VVSLATAHPAKFPDAVEAATGVRPDLPAALSDLYEREERFTVLPNDLAAVRAHIAEHARPVGASAGAA
jgi:threonine synthase